MALNLKSYDFLPLPVSATTIAPGQIQQAQLLFSQALSNALDTAMTSIRNETDALLQSGLQKQYGLRNIFTRGVQVIKGLFDVNDSGILTAVAGDRSWPQVFAENYVNQAMCQTGLSLFQSVRNGQEGFEFNVRVPAGSSYYMVVYGLDPDKNNIFATLGSDGKTVEWLKLIAGVPSGPTTTGTMSYTVGNGPVLTLSGIGVGGDASFTIPQSAVIAMSGLTSIFMTSIQSGRIAILNSTEMPFSANYTASGQVGIRAPTVLNNSQLIDLMEFGAMAVGTAPQLGIDISAVDQFQLNMGFAITGGKPAAGQNFSMGARTSGATSKYVHRGVAKAYLCSVPGWNKCVQNSEITSGAIVAPQDVLPTDFFMNGIDQLANRSAGSWVAAHIAYMQRDNFWIRMDSMPGANGVSTYFKANLTTLTDTAAIATTTGITQPAVTLKYSFFGSAKNFVLPYGNVEALIGGTDVASDASGNLIPAWLQPLAGDYFAQTFARLVGCAIEANVFPPVPSTADQSVLDAISNANAGVLATSLTSAQIAVLDRYAISTVYLRSKKSSYFTPYAMQSGNANDPRSGFDFIDHYSIALLAYGTTFYTYTYSDSLGLANFQDYPVSPTPTAAMALVYGGSYDGGAVIEVFGKSSDYAIAIDGSLVTGTQVYATGESMTIEAYENGVLTTGIATVIRAGLRAGTPITGPMVFNVGDVVNAGDLVVTFVAAPTLGVSFAEGSEMAVTLGAIYTLRPIVESVGPVTFAWSGAASGTADSFVYDNAKAGDQIVVTVTDTHGNTASATLTTYAALAVGIQGPPGYSAGDTSIVGVPYVFKAIVSGGAPGTTLIYKWYYGNNGGQYVLQSSQSDTVTMFFVAGGGSLMVDVNGVQANLGIQTAAPEVNVTVNGSTLTNGVYAVVEGMSVGANVFADLFGTDVTYSWSPSNVLFGFSSNGNAAQIEHTAITGRVTLYATATSTVLKDASGNPLSVMSSGTVFELTPPQMSVAIEQSGSTFTANVTPVGTYTYQWTLNGTVVASTNEFVQTGPGGLLKVAVKNATGGTATAQMTIGALIVPVTLKSYVNGVQGVIGSTFTLVASGGDGNAYAWSGGITSTGPNATLTISTQTTVTVTSGGQQASLTLTPPTYLQIRYGTESISSGDVLEVSVGAVVTLVATSNGTVTWTQGQATFTMTNSNINVAARASGPGGNITWSATFKPSSNAQPLMLTSSAATVLPGSVATVTATVGNTVKTLTVTGTSNLLVSADRTVVLPGSSATVTATCGTDTKQLVISGGQPVSDLTLTNTGLTIYPGQNTTITARSGSLVRTAVVSAQSDDTVLQHNGVTLGRFVAISLSDLPYTITATHPVTWSGTGNIFTVRTLPTTVTATTHTGREIVVTVGLPLVARFTDGQIDVTGGLPAYTVTRVHNHFAYVVDSVGNRCTVIREVHESYVSAIVLVVVFGFVILVLILLNKRRL